MENEEWRVIRFEKYDAFMNMALDQAGSEAIKNDLSPPTIRLYGWKPSAVSIGYFQEIRREVNLQKCKEYGIDIVRRRTGGGAVYHDSNGEITYSIIAPERFFPKDVMHSYEEICGWVMQGLTELNIKGEFRPINDIQINGKKISGNAQTRREGILLQHGTILYDVDVHRMFTVLNVSKEKISDKMIANVEERVTSISKINGARMEEVEKALFNGFTKEKEFFEGTWSEWERKRAEELTKTQYRTKEWNFLR